MAERFWKQVRKTAHCWLWNKIKTRYGRILNDRGESIGAHQASWIIHFGPIPEGSWVLHSCDNPPCTNPAHLFLGTNADNQKDCYKKGRSRLQRPMNHAAREQHGMSKLTEAQVEFIRSLPKPLPLNIAVKLMKEFGICRTHIYKIRSGGAW